MASKRIDCEFAFVGLGCANCGADGLLGGTEVALAQGSRDVASLVVGDQVLTLEHGVQHLQDIQATDIWRHPGTCPNNVLPSYFPPGAIGNRVPLVLQDETMVALSCPSYAEKTGQPIALIRVADMDGFNGATRFQPDAPARLFVLKFAHEQVISVAGGALVECPSAHGFLALGEPDMGRRVTETDKGYPKLTRDQADVFLSCLEQDLAEKT
ncbi:Hint domain-containing protein [Shimia sp.]|uniref:Hint domain-containing protein n=1 Tax=Shimia sp. TaxID=1954381 RepID=UPI00329A13E8